MPRLPRNLPKLRILELSRHVADLLLVSDGDIASVRNRFTRFAWHLFFFSWLLFTAFHFLVRTMIGPTFVDVAWLPRTVRLVESACYGYLLLVLWLVAYCHYRYLLRPGLDLRFQNIAFFFLATALIFGRLYYSLYNAVPELYRYDASLIAPAVDLTLRGFRDSLGFLEFLVYSGCTMMTLDYPRITSASLLISALNLVEAVSGLAMIGLLIATFVEWTRREKEGKEGEQVICVVAGDLTRPCSRPAGPAADGQR